MLSPLLQPTADADTLLSAAGLVVSKALGVGTWCCGSLRSPWWAWRNRGDREDMDFFLLIITR
jgi:hypothetical protein